MSIVELEKHMFSQVARIWMSPRQAGLLEFATTQGPVKIQKAALLRRALERYFEDHQLEPVIPEYEEWVRAGAPKRKEDNDTDQAGSDTAGHRSSPLESIIADILG